MLVGERSEPRAVAVVVDALEHVAHLRRELRGISQVDAGREADGVDDGLHALLALGGEYLGDVLESVWQMSDAHRLSEFAVEIVAHVVHHLISRFVLVVANNDLSHGMEPLPERVEIPFGLGGGAVRR